MARFLLVLGLTLAVGGACGSEGGLPAGPEADAAVVKEEPVAKKKGPPRRRTRRPGPGS
ncbi:MAG: hypothetical protein ACYS0K_05490 [Planctomycetota bacterium]